MNKTHFILCIFLALCCFSSSTIATPVPSEVTYTITDLGRVVINGPGARDINQSGQVALNLDGIGYIWDKGTLSPPGGVPNNNNPFAINDSRHLTWLKNLRGQFFDGNSITQLPTLEPGQYLIALDLNNNDVVVGYGRRDGNDRAFRWDGTMTELEPLTTDGASRAVAINDAGVIVGDAKVNNVPVKWVNDQIEALPFLPGMNRGAATAVNASGQIVGYTRNTNKPSIRSVEHGILWSGETIISLGPLDLGPLGVFRSTNPWGINDLGEIVGQAKSPHTGGNELAFIYRNGAMLNLNDLVDDPAWILRVAYSINNAGQIVGTGRTMGEWHAFLLTPIPEPTTLTLAVLGLLGLAGYRRRRRRN